LNLSPGPGDQPGKGDFEYSSPTFDGRAAAIDGTRVTPR